MKQWELSKYMADIGKKGGYARAHKLSTKRRSEIAYNAGIASGLARINKKNNEYRKMLKK